MEKSGSRFRHLELFLKLLAAAGAIVAFLVSFGQWLDARRTSLRQEQAALLEQQFEHNRDFKRAIFERQTGLYFEAAETAATIATALDPVQRRKAVNRFNTLYYGDMVMVESPGVEASMVHFHDCMNAGEHGCSLGDLALAIGCATRRSLRKTWDVDFGKLETNDRYCKDLPE